MKFLERLDRIVRPIAIPNLTQIIIAGQALMFLACVNDNDMLQRGMLIWAKVLEGELWRLVTFLFIPFAMHPIWLFFSLYLFHIFGSAVERHWGFVRYCGFLYLGIFFTLIASAFVLDAPVSGNFLELTVFLAFATYNPDYILRLFFVLPVKVKWLAWLQAAGYTFAFLVGPLPVKLLVAASVGNYLVFFAPDLISRIRNVRRRMEWEARQYDPGTQARHTCHVCKVNSNTHPKMDFRYCSKCEGALAYCEDHLRNHEHVK